MMPTIYILTGIHNDLDYTKSFLKSVDSLNYKNVVCVIVDDGSIDGSFEFIKSKYPNINLIQGDGNLWWTGAMELGVEFILKNAKNSDFVLTINNDCVFGKDYVDTLLARIKQNKKWIVGSLVLSKDKSIIDAGVNIDWKTATFKPINNYKNKSFAYVDVLSTKGTLFPVKIFKEIGNFDCRNFPHYLSDYEFTCRAKKFGYDLIINYGSVLTNDNLRTGYEIKQNDSLKIQKLPFILFSKKSKINIRDQIKFFIKCCPANDKIECIWALVKKIFKKLTTNI